MQITSILGVPASILALLVSHSISAGADLEERSPAAWAPNPPPQPRSPQDINRRRDVEEHLRRGRAPVGVMKMSADEGEKFFMEYWQFEQDNERTRPVGAPLRARDEDEEARLLANASAVISFKPPFALHIELETGYEDLRARRDESAAVLALLEKRGFACPADTADCSAIGYPNSCCALDETCFIIQDTGLGPVGCCPKGSNCGGTITTCNAPNTACADSLGGGCCIPDYVCEGVGCVMNSVTTIVETITNSVSSSTTVQTSTTVSTITPSSTTAVSTQSTTISTSPSASSTTVGISTITNTATSTSINTATGVPPVRPTSITTSSATTDSGGLCPTGFYACNAYYAGGCCRTGRNCDTTSCPVVSSTTIVSSGETIVVPVGTAATTNSPTGACAAGWSTCAASDGGNCCPSGYQCGTASCSSLSSTSTAVAQKESPNNGLTLTLDLVNLLGIMAVALVLV